MKTKLLSAAIAGFMAATPVMAELTFSALSYRTGAYGNNGIPFADGYLDYFTLLQERDGGIGGESINVIECETAYNTEKGVECYELQRVKAFCHTHLCQLGSPTSLSQKLQLTE